jgi:hypothetical protein
MLVSIVSDRHRIGDLTQTLFLFDNNLDFIELQKTKEIQAKYFFSL